jgi:hypothetical protein
MTELMKRYEADFEKGLIHECYQSWLETEISDNKRYIATLESKIRMYKYEIKQLKAQLTWRPVSEKPERGETVIATYLNSYGKRRRVRAVYIRQYEEESDYDDDSDYEYNEENDTYYLKEGWYELIDNWDDYSSVAIVEGVVDYWMPMPPAPEEI